MKYTMELPRDLILERKTKCWPSTLFIQSKCKDFNQFLYSIQITALLLSETIEFSVPHSIYSIL